ncbi:MAG: hypothetical protein ACFFKA_16110 [Candidatus Thorarchaeota archaeon]
MEHKNLSIEIDRSLIEKIIDDIDMRYVVLFMYIIRNDLFKDLSNPILIENYERVLILDEIFKSNVLKSWDEDFIEIAIDLGLFKNIRNFNDFQQKDNDFSIKLGEETITIENNVISIPDDILFLMINKKFKNINRRNFNLALTKLKGVRCETTNIIHPFVLGIGEHDYCLSDDLYFILDQWGNIYQTVKIEITIEGFYDRFSEIKKNAEDFLELFDPKLLNKAIQKKITSAIDSGKEIFNYLKDEGIKLSEKFNFEKVDQNEKVFKNWYTKLILLININYKMKNIENSLLDLKKIYSGKSKANSYLKFIEKVSFNEDGIIDKIQLTLIDLRNKLIEINNEISKFTKKDLKLLNLDYEKYVIMSSES